MEEIKICTELLKDIKKDIFEKWKYEIDGDHIVLLNRNSLYIFDSCDFYIDLDKLNKDRKIIHTHLIESIIKNTHNAIDIRWQYGLYEKLGKLNCRVYTHPLTHEDIYVDEKLLKYFDKTCTIKGTKPTNPVYVYEHHELKGVVCPVRKV